MRTSENSVKAKFGECTMDELQALWICTLGSSPSVSKARKWSPASFALSRIRNDEAPIEQALDENSLGPLDGHPLYAQLHQRAAQLGDASPVVGIAALEDLAPGFLYEAEGVFILGPIDPCCCCTFVVIHVLD
jgi:hypothetical protein